MLRDIIYRLSEWYRVNRRIIYFFLIILFLSRFLYLNYINWTKGELCSGHGGIQYGMDSMRFLHGADKIINHQDFADCEENYMGYAFVIAFVKISGLDLSFVLIIQLIFALLSSLALYDLGKSITKSKTIGLLSAGLYLINPFITQWHLYIHTESFYSSMLVISTWSIYKAVKNNNLKFYVLSLIIIFYTALIRPNGMVTVPIFFFFVIITRKINSRIKIISVISVIITFLFLIFYFPIFKDIRKNMKAGDSIIKGKVISEFHDICIKMPKDTENKSDSTFRTNYIINHPLPVIKLTILRVAAGLIPIYRPMDSIKFIIRFLLWMLPAYILSLIGLFFLRRNLGVQIIAAVIISHLLIFSMTFADEDFRYLIHFLPLIYLMGVLGFYTLYKKWFNHFINGKNIILG